MTAGGARLPEERLSTLPEQENRNVQGRLSWFILGGVSVRSVCIGFGWFSCRGFGCLTAGATRRLPFSDDPVGSCCNARITCFCFCLLSRCLWRIERGIVEGCVGVCDCGFMVSRSLFGEAIVRSRGRKTLMRVCRSSVACFVLFIVHHQALRTASQWIRFSCTCLG